MSTTPAPASSSQPQSGPSGRGQKRGGNRSRGAPRGRGRGQANAGRTGGLNTVPTEEGPAPVIQATAGSDAVPDAETGTEAEEALCHICTEPIKYFAVSECNHRTCHVCAVRLRALYKKLECVMCKVGSFSSRGLSISNFNEGTSKQGCLHCFAGRSFQFVLPGRPTRQGSEALRVLRVPGNDGRYPASAPIQLPGFAVRFHW